MLGAPEHGHEPVLLREVMDALSVKGGEVVMDCTVGRGGHALEIVKALRHKGTEALRDGEGGGAGKLIALDVDPENLKHAKGRLVEVGGKVEVRMFHANFGEAVDVLEMLGIEGVDGLLADFGVSTNQLLAATHGLSFNEESALDMRLDPRIEKKASDLLKEWDDRRIAEVLQDYAQEKFAWRIARKIIQTREVEPILTTGQLARLVRSVVPGKWGQIDPATRTFQALRMAVNAELESLQDLLATVPEMMAPGGRAVFISFHSGEDRLVKQATKDWEAKGLCEVLTKKPVEASEEEMARNPRSRSAKMRAVVFKRS